MSAKNFKPNDVLLYIGTYDALRGKKLYYKWPSTSHDVHVVGENPDNLKFGTLHTVHGSDLILAETSGAALTSSQDSTVTITSPYTWTYYSGGSAVDNQVSPVSGSGIIFTKDDNAYKLICECGSSKVYGENVASDLHSTWCPLYRKS